jgi:hypothetical protein
VRDKVRRIGSLALIGTVLIGGLLALAPPTRAAEGRQCFAETGKCVNPLFFTYWQEHGGLAINGYPISDEIVQNLENGTPYTVQYFERVRMEYHPENTVENQVLLGQFGRRLYTADPPVAAQPGATFFPETGHNVAGDFLAYWQGQGGLTQFGYPLSEVLTQQLEDGKTYQVQYFERARFEAHPENAAPYNVLLGQFGRQIYADTREQVVPPCTTSALRADLTMMGAAGAREGNIHLINTSDNACSLAGAPQFAVIDQDGNPLPVQIRGPQGVTQTVGIAAAGRGQAIAVPVRWTNYCGPTPAQAVFVLTMPDGGQLRIAQGISVPPCLGAGEPSTLTFGAFTSGPQPEAVANTVLGYFGAINAREYRAAYAALGNALQAQQSYEDFAAGYATTAQVAPSAIMIGGSTRQGIAYEVSLTLTATQTDGATHVFSGNYFLGRENGSWKIVAAEVVQQ